MSCLVMSFNIRGNDNPFQYSCLANTVDRGAWQAAAVHGVAKSQARPKRLSSQAWPHKR